MNELIQILVIVGSFLAGLLIAVVFMQNKVEAWRIRWIEMEHDLARATGREPRHIDQVTKDKS